MKKPCISLQVFIFLLSLLLTFFPKPSSQQPSPLFLYPRLFKAYVALQAWKLSIISDPNGFTSNWYGADVCSYNGVYCAPVPDEPQATTVAGIDLNHANIAGKLPEELGLLSDLALFHINSNRFWGIIPLSFAKLSLLFELDVSNNKLSGPFPAVLLYLPSLKYLDIRFNEFFGGIPPALFDLKLDAIFLNNNKFTSILPDNIANSPASAIVLANNYFKGCLPSSLANMAGTLDEIILMNTGIHGCLPSDIGLLKRLTVFDVSFNHHAGSLPESLGNTVNLEQLNVAHNKLSGKIPEGVCSLPKLQNFTYSYNFFWGEPSNCLKLPSKDDRKNCIPNRPLQRPPHECKFVNAFPVECSACVCF